MPNVKDLTGKVFGRLTVTGHAGRIGPSRSHKWHCKCQCGGVATVDGAHLRAGQSRSCGCLQRERAKANGARSTTHGQSASSLYAIWDSMHQRCKNPNRRDFENYGGRGIKVCERWATFAAFAADMGDRPAGHSIDRIDPNGDYEPGNCRWASRTQQGRNTTSNRRIEWQGQSLCLSEWAEQLKVNKNTLLARLARGWSVERALTAPIQKKEPRRG